jgi:hypothetical protein
LKVVLCTILHRQTDSLGGTAVVLPTGKGTTVRVLLQDCKCQIPQLLGVVRVRLGFYRE